MDFFSSVYGSTNKVNRKRMWNELKAIYDIPNTDWMLIGDLNTISSRHEKLGGKSPTYSQVSELKEILNKCGLIDLGANGPRFTWNNKRVGAANIKERIDRAVENSGWKNMFHKAQVYHLPYYNSDHRVLIVYLESIWAEDPR